MEPLYTILDLDGNVSMGFEKISSHNAVFTHLESVFFERDMIRYYALSALQVGEKALCTFRANGTSQLYVRRDA